MLGVGDYLWRLIPANPILLRVVEGGGKRRRDLFIRCAYLGLLVVVVLLSLMTSDSTIGGASLADLAKESSKIFERMSYLQLGLVALLAPIFTAGAITQEKDSQTYDILLSTPMTNGQIVLGSLLSRLFFVVALLVSGIPIFSITQIFGGVAIKSIVMSFLIAAATAFVTGALAMAIAVFKVGTRRTIFSFYLFIVLYLVGLWLLDQLAFFKIALDNGTLSRTSWLTGLHPFLALRVTFNDPEHLPPSIADLPSDLRFWPVGWYLSNPASFYATFMFFLSLVLVMPSIVLLRKLAQSTGTLRTWLLQKLKISTGDRTKKPRSVWSNPIAWREAKTKASAARASVLRYAFMAAGVIGACTILFFFSRLEPAKMSVNRDSYNPLVKTLSVYSGDSATTYKTTGGTQVTINGRETTVDQLRGEYAVDVTVSGTTLTSITATSIARQLPPDTARQYLLGAIVLEVAVILLIVTNAAASTVTREKEDGTLDLLLSTPITSRYYIWGKLRGLVSFVLPLVAVPAVSIVIFVVYDAMRFTLGRSNDASWVILPEAAIILPGTLIIISAFAAILGMQMSLRCRTTVMAVMSSVGIVAGICAGLGFCGLTLLDSRAGSGPLGVIFGSFSPFTLIAVLINPYKFASGAFEDTETVAQVRLGLFIFSWVAVAAYAGIVWVMYKSMVKNFDMTIRRQSR